MGNPRAQRVEVQAGRPMANKYHHQTYGETARLSCSSNRALQTRLAGIWRPTSKMTLIDIGYGFFIMRFYLSQDYHHALMDGPWFVGDQYLYVQAWEADFHPHVAKISTTAVWIHLEQLPIEYYHPEFLHHIGNKLGKLLKIDAVTSAAIRGWFTRLCV